MARRPVSPTSLLAVTPALAAGLAASCIVGVLFYLATARMIESELSQRFASHVRTATNTITARIKSYDGLLHGAAGMFRTRAHVTRQDFRDYVSGLALAREYPAVDVINFAAYVRHEELPALSQRMLRERLPEDPPFRVKSALPADTYTVLIMVEPPLLMEQGWGRLLLTKTSRWTPRDHGTIGISDQLVELISGPNRSGLAVRKPIYRTGMPTSNVQERRAAYIGSVGIAFSVSKLVQGVLGELPVRQVRMTVSDLGLKTAPGRRVLYDSSGSAARPVPPLASSDEAFISSATVDYHGRPWTLTFSTPRRAMATSFEEVLPWVAALSGMLGALLVLAFVRTLTASRQRAIALADVMTRQLRAAESRLQRSHLTLRRLATHAERIKEDECKRIAREIHDDLGQNLLALRMEAAMLEANTRARQPRIHRRVSANLLQIDAAVRGVRQIINELRPNVLDLGLNAVVEWQVKEFRQRTGLPCELLGACNDGALDERAATALYRVLQESLSNIVRHAAASQVQVVLDQQDGCLRLIVKDNGVGMAHDAPDRPGAFGLFGIEERMHVLGGSLAVSSTPGGGTTIAVALPQAGGVAAAGAR